MVESSKESTAAGEYVIDLAEYSMGDGDRQNIAYYQLKHSTVRTAKAVTFVEMKETIAGFAERFREMLSKRRGRHSSGSVTFSFVTNRPISEGLKADIEAIRKDSKCNRRIREQLQQTAKLKGEGLRMFLSSLLLVDCEGDYIVQKHRLHGEVAEYIAGFVDSHEIDKLINLVSERALPETNGEIHREDILQRLGVTSIRGLFPAPRAFETLPSAIRREQHDDLLKHIVASSAPTLVHAAGGVGKSITALQVAESLPRGSVGIVYDCFGGGKYRNPSEPRHRACDALIQIANELAALGLCKILIGHAGTPVDALFLNFLHRLDEASRTLRKARKGALLVVLIDAADNAEMAAAEIGDRCFARALLRESFPVGCRLVVLCRTERINLLQPADSVRKFLLKPFSKMESAIHLRQTYSTASDKDCLEFHRLTGGNPRVQANALASGERHLTKLLANLGPSGTTVNDQIAEQLRAAVTGVKGTHTPKFEAQVDAICRGLANLPPFVPLEVLARAADVDVSSVLSFISDLGRPLWHSDDAVQFRDEPTETWFRDKFGAENEQIRAYVSALEPLAGKYPYVAKALPQLLLKSGDYDRLVTLALSDDLLPDDSPIDERDIRVYRLQFAFKAALKLRRMADAAKLAFRAGEEVAGDKRQLTLLQENTDLIAPLQDEHRVQELAYRQVFAGLWEGSENVYSAALLSSVKDFQGEARSYLRTARRWLQIYFEQREKGKQREQDQHFQQEQLKDDDLAEFAWTYYNLDGAEATVRFLVSWKPPEVVFRVTRLLVWRLIDVAKFSDIDEIAQIGAKNPYVMIAVADALSAVARFPPKGSLRRSLNLLANRKTRIPKQPLDYNDAITPALVSFAEATAATGLSRKKIQSILKYYTSSVADHSVASDFQDNVRRTFFRAVALRAVLARNLKPETKTLLPKKDSTSASETKRSRRQLNSSEERELNQIIGALLPWYIVRARLITGDAEAKDINLEEVRTRAKAALSERYKTYDPIRFEISRVRFEVLAFKISTTDRELEEFATYVISRTDSRFNLFDRLRAVRAAFRLDHLSSLRAPLEQSCSNTIQMPGTDGPEERANWFIQLARAVLPVSQLDAAAYFADAVEAVSKFGDEMVERWEALASIAKRASDATVGPEVTYRFIRCGEVVGDTVAREKYWNRNDVFRVAARLDPCGAFAALSRWRDRDVGWFGDQLKALATEVVQTGTIPAMAGWCLSGFKGCNGSAEYAAVCIRKEKTKQTQQRMLNMAIRDCELAAASHEDWKALDAVANECRLEKGRLSELVAAYQRKNVTAAAPKHVYPTPLNRKSEKASWNRFFRGINLLAPEGLGKALGRESTEFHGSEEFWSEVIKRVPFGRESTFLNVLLIAENTSCYDIGNAIRQIRQRWLNKAAVKRAWPSFLVGIGKRFAAELSNHFRLDGWLDLYGIDDSSVLSIKNGMIEGLSQSLDLVDASTFFGFARNIANRLSTEEAAGLLDFALARFEIHIPSDHGDGPWAEWLVAPVTIPNAVAGLIWSALGSPKFDTRWEAAHCVRRLCENSCVPEIAALIEWMKGDVVGPFGSHRFPFYNLHAKLYLLIAFARLTAEKPTVLVPHSKVFAETALGGMPHVLIQKTAADIALSLERVQPGLYTCDTLAKLRRVGIPTLPPKSVTGHANDIDTPWHAKGEIDLTRTLHFGYDFDRYWFTPLGRIFGVSEKQVTELAREVAVDEMGIADNDGYQQDPRQGQWNSLNQRGIRGTWSNHGEYCYVDNYAFYYTYHSLLSVAARLISNMPVVRRGEADYEEERWSDWLRSWSLTRTDGRWVADRRDPTPVRRRKWIEDDRQENWLWTVTAEDFFDCLSNYAALPHSLCVSGHWTDHKNGLVEEISVNSSLVNPETSNALANALRTCEDSYGFALPPYSSDEEILSAPPFDSIPWIQLNDPCEKGLDRFDPHAKEIMYPPKAIEGPIAEMLGLTADDERREWRFAEAKEPAIICQLWSDKRMFDREEEPFRSGESISASISLLKTLCSKTEKNLMFEIKINRRQDRRYRSTDDEDPGYVHPWHKIFIFSSDGILRDKEKSYRLGKTAGR